MNDTVSVLLVSADLGGGGAQRFVSTLLGHLDRQRLRPSLCLFRPEIGFPLADDVPVSSFRYRRIWHAPRTVYRLRRLLEERRPDVVLSNIAATNLVTGAALRGSAHRPAWIARIGNDPQRHDLGIRTFLARRIYPLSDRIVANSAGLAKAVADYYPFTEGRIEVLPNPAEFDSIEAQSRARPVHEAPGDRPLLVAVGRLFEQKRYDVLVDAFARVRRTREVDLWICGEGPARKTILAHVERHGLSESVRLLGFCANPFAVMRQASLFVMSSDHEGLPNALIEAQGLGIPAVATSCPHGPDEIIENGSTGLLTPVGDASALAEAISGLLADPDRRRSMSEAARQRARERFGVAAVAPRWEALILRQAAARSRQP